jgi:hypothetical protein
VQTLLGLEPALVAFGQCFDHLGSGVVSGTDEIDARVAQTDHQ